MIGSGETNARVDEKNWWCWVFQTPQASCHVIAASRGADVLDALLDGGEPEIWGSDVWAPQVRTAAGRHQACLSRQVRDLNYVVEADVGLEQV